MAHARNRPPLETIKIVLFKPEMVAGLEWSDFPGDVRGAVERCNPGDGVGFVAVYRGKAVGALKVNIDSQGDARTCVVTAHYQSPAFTSAELYGQLLRSGVEWASKIPGIRSFTVPAPFLPSAGG